MERSEFISKLGLGLVLTCAGCELAGCSKKDDAPKPAPVNNIFTIDLAANLLSIGDSIITDQIIVVRLAAGNVANSFTAVKVICTHRGGTIAYNADQGIFICPLHGSHFSTSGQVLQGPASTALQQYNVAIIDNTILAVSA